jgi:hypothetical protein
MKALIIKHAGVRYAVPLVSIGGIASIPRPLAASIVEGHLLPWVQLASGPKQLNDFLPQKPLDLGAIKPSSRLLHLHDCPEKVYLIEHAEGVEDVTPYSDPRFALDPKGQTVSFWTPAHTKNSTEFYS